TQKRVIVAVPSTRIWAMSAATYTGQCDHAKSWSPATTSTSAGPIANHASPMTVGTIDGLTRPCTRPGTHRAMLAAIATSGTTGVASMNSAGTNTSMVGYVHPSATGNLPRSTMTYVTSTSTSRDATSGCCQGASVASATATTRNTPAATPWVM